MSGASVQTRFLLLLSSGSSIARSAASDRREISQLYKQR